MKTKGRSIFKKILKVVYMLTATAFLSVCLIPYINPGTYWIISLLGLGFPILVLLLIIFLAIWFMMKSRLWWITALILLIGFKQISAVFSFHISQKFDLQKDSSTVRIMQYNVMGEESVRQARITEKKINPLKIVQFISKQNPDILCLQEFTTQLKKEPNTLTVLDSLGYTHYYLADNSHLEKNKYSGVAIFSKYPIVEASTIYFDADNKAESVIYADVEMGGKRFRMITFHLQSNGIDRKSYKKTDRSQYGEQIEMKIDKSVAGSLRYAYSQRYLQSKTIATVISQSPYPVIVSGDFNDVPNSNAYFTIKGSLQDAFLKKGSFIGRTFRYISPTLRIDYILADPKLKVLQYTRPMVPFSDHYPIMADLQFP